MSVRVLRLESEKGKKVSVLIEGDHPLHPEGGGQPGDSGVFFSDNCDGFILNTRKDNGLCVLDLKLKSGELKEGDLKEGDLLEIERDEVRHSVLSRMHSGEHVFSRVMEDMRSGLSVYKVAVGEGRTGVYLRYDGDLDWDFLFEAEDRAREVVKASLPVEALVLPIEEAKELDGLKARWDRVSDEAIRVVRIPEFDLIACSGSHVENTSDIGTLFVESFKGSSPEWEVVFSLDSDRDVLYSREMRRLISRANCRYDEVGKTMDRLGEENGSLRKQLAKVQQYVTLPWETRDLDGLTFDVLHSIGLPKELVTSSCRKRAEGRPDSIVLALIDDGVSRTTPFMLCVGGDFTFDSKGLLGSNELKVRGGGRGGVLSGQTECRSLDVWLKVCRGFIS